MGIRVKLAQPDGGASSVGAWPLACSAEPASGPGITDLAAKRPLPGRGHLAIVFLMLPASEPVWDAWAW